MQQENDIFIFLLLVEKIKRKKKIETMNKNKSTYLHVSTYLGISKSQVKKMNPNERLALCYGLFIVEQGDSDKSAYVMATREEVKAFLLLEGVLLSESNSFIQTNGSDESNIRVMQWEKKYHLENKLIPYGVAFIIDIRDKKNKEKIRKSTQKEIAEYLNTSIAYVKQYVSKEKRLALIYGLSIHRNTLHYRMASGDEIDNFFSKSKKAWKDEKRYILLRYGIPEYLNSTLGVKK